MYIQQFKSTAQVFCKLKISELKITVPDAEIILVSDTSCHLVERFVSCSFLSVNWSEDFWENSQFLMCSAVQKG